LVFDEADRLFEMGFAEQLNEIVRECPTERQTVLFSATLPKMIVQFSRAGLKDPQLIRLDTDVKMSEELRLAFFCLRSNEKLAALLYLVRHIIPPNQQTIIFTATRHHSELLHAVFEKIGVSSTMVYGSMDQDARTSNLKAFRQGSVSYLIVTDLAARGIDVPLLNNVINYHFPPSPKLFVHRCGRAARQGRIGYAFSLVDPEEMAFMMDVQKFLGQDFDTGFSDDCQKVQSYSLDEMTPSMIHTGLLPQDAIDEENDFVKRSLEDDDTISTLYRISENGLKQYKRTRQEASRDGVKAAKKITKSEAIRTIHPLIIGSDPKRCGQDVIDKANFIRVLQSFRPSQTVFETGIGTGSASYFNANGPEAGKAKHKKAADVMKALREVTASALERNKKKLPSITNVDGPDHDGEGSDGGNDVDEFDDYDNSEEEESDGQEHSGDNIDDDDGDDDDSAVKMEALDDSSLVSYQPERMASKRLTAAERRRLKKYGAITSPSGQQIFENGEQKKSGKFQDEKFYMTYGNEDTRETFAEESMQPLSNLRSSETFGATMMDQAIQGISPDDELENTRKKKLMRWDPKKRKFVKVSSSFHFKDQEIFIYLSMLF
jgi:ATP-dependent RNA helicase DDX54/DBP10